MRVDGMLLNERLASCVVHWSFSHIDTYFKAKGLITTTIIIFGGWPWVCGGKMLTGSCLNSSPRVSLTEAAGKGAKPSAAGEEAELSPSRLDIRVGKLISVEKVRIP